MQILTWGSGFFVSEEENYQLKLKRAFFFCVPPGLGRDIISAGPPVSALHRTFCTGSGVWRTRPEPEVALVTGAPASVSRRIPILVLLLFLPSLSLKWCFIGMNELLVEGLNAPHFLPACHIDCLNVCFQHILSLLSSSYFLSLSPLIPSSHPQPPPYEWSPYRNLWSVVWNPPSNCLRTDLIFWDWTPCSVWSINPIYCPEKETCMWPTCKVRATITGPRAISPNVTDSVNAGQD